MNLTFGLEVHGHIFSAMVHNIVVHVKITPYDQYSIIVPEIIMVI